ncbi:cytochrome b5-like [Mytilus californianus]|uniref:cytochrome b5-like n=1 Tax=Mytilus californianus TaxID=6549 RepID=UPI0022469848|nr:cytochrome b5-like [Mytilus californianus]
MESKILEMSTILQRVHDVDTSLIKPTDNVVHVQTNKYTHTDVAEHSDMTSCWIIIDSKVYDVTKFLYEHPGGYDILLEHAGRDATCAFEEVGHSRDALQILQDFCIGDVVSTK